MALFPESRVTVRTMHILDMLLTCLWCNLKPVLEATWTSPCEAQASPLFSPHLKKMALAQIIYSIQLCKKSTNYILHKPWSTGCNHNCLVLKYAGPKQYLDEWKEFCLPKKWGQFWWFPPLCRRPPQFAHTCATEGIRPSWSAYGRLRGLEQEVESGKDLLWSSHSIHSASKFKPHID